ncbi:hypothetical protein DEU56DRAFT_947147 [Suillus clintonianus]|uniref:uncharacterized protein n=1 Tax=Suillus clintonianus TaxID=1904413 RepID=UPI001B8702ED|nr:uncharacterized protein DEU56DRAFT_947147 [Suillus clintonianus]KAG2135974.1 hypothetical protein DEU56DRAFT_947147 [Suillus clintonianus]
MTEFSTCHSYPDGQYRCVTGQKIVRQQVMKASLGLRGDNKSGTCRNYSHTHGIWGTRLIMFICLLSKFICYVLGGWHERQALPSDSIVIPFTNGITEVPKCTHKLSLKQGARTCDFTNNMSENNQVWPCEVTTMVKHTNIVHKPTHAKREQAPAGAQRCFFHFLKKMASRFEVGVLRRYGTYFRHGGTLPDIDWVSLTWWTVVVRWKIVSFPLGPEIANLNFDVAVVDASRSFINCCSTLSLSLRWSNFSDVPLRITYHSRQHTARSAFPFPIHHTFNSAPLETFTPPHTWCLSARSINELDGRNIISKTLESKLAANTSQIDGLIMSEH